MESKEIKVVEEYKYLGCVINEQLGSRRMVEERAKAGARALSEWLRKCRVTVGEVRGETFVKLMEVLVGSVLMYGADRGVGRWRTTWADRGGADASCQDLPGGREVAPTGVPTI